MIVLMASGNAAITSFSISGLCPHYLGYNRRRAGRSGVWQPALLGAVLPGALLFILTFILNMLGDLMVNRLKHRMMGT
jgi:ABC-type phosphate transport system permease subunit